MSAGNSARPDELCGACRTLGRLMGKVLSPRGAAGKKPPDPARNGEKMRAAMDGAELAAAFGAFGM